MSKLICKYDPKHEWFIDGECIDCTAEIEQNERPLYEVDRTTETVDLPGDL